MLKSGFRLAIDNHICPKCGACKGNNCLRPSGKVAWPPHENRVRLLTKAEIKLTLFLPHFRRQSKQIQTEG